MADDKWLNGLRTVALIAAVAGAGGSLALMFRAGQRTPGFLLVLFTFWVISPFVALVWANMASKRWSATTRTTLYLLTLAISLASVAIYGDKLAIAPSGSAHAFAFVVVPPGSWLLLAVVVPTAALISRRLSHRTPGNLKNKNGRPED